MFFHQVTFVFRSQVSPPVYREFEGMSFGYGFFQNLNTFRIRQADKVMFQDKLQTFDQLFIKHIVQELDIIHTVIQSPLYTIFDKVFRQLHIFSNLIESNFRFDHPELGQVARCIGVFGTECRSERINSSQRHGSQFTFQLA